MALEHKINKEVFAKLPEAVAAEYELQDGNYFLQTVGMVPKGRLDEFRTNNIKLKEEKEVLYLRANLLGDMTEAEFKQLKEKAESSGGTLTDEEKKVLIEGEVEKRIVKMREDSDTKIKDLSDRLNGSNTQLSEVLITNELNTVGMKLKVRPEAAQDFIARGKSIFKLVENKVTPMQGDDIIMGKDGVTPLSISDWAAGLSTEAAHLFEESKGGGGRHQGRQTGGANDGNLRGMSRMKAARQT